MGNFNDEDGIIDDYAEDVTPMYTNESSFFANVFTASDDDNSQQESTTEDESDSISDVENPMGETFSTLNSNPFYPFKNELDMLALLFFKYGQDNYSERLTKNIFAFAEAYCKAAMKARDQKCGAQDYNPDNDFSAFSSITKSHLRKKSKVPVFKKEVYPVQKEDYVYEMTLNKPSEFIRLLLGNPEKCRKLTCLPDHTPDRRTSLNQCLKWLYNPEFRCPMIIGDTPLED